MSGITERKLKKGEILYHEGDANDCAYIIAAGEFILYSKSVGKRLDCERRGGGSIVGETSILTNQPRAVTVEALEDSLVYRLPAADILQRFKSLDPVLRACVETTIDFVARFNNHSARSGAAPLVPGTLREAENIISQIQFELDIEKGLENGEFDVHYQPIVSLPDGAIEGFEALMRWQHPLMGPVSPDRFIPVAETLGSIKDLTELVLTKACAMAAKVNQLNADLGQAPKFMSINVSGQDIGRADFVDFLAHAMDRNDLSAAQIKLEITETALVPDNEITEANLLRLRALGYGISIDDFGTGYSNLAYLKTLPLTTLKIDRAFAADVTDSGVSCSIVQMLVGLGHALNADVIAEGVETQADADILHALGCRFAQGFHFYRPMQSADLLGLLQQAAPQESHLA